MIKRRTRSPAANTANGSVNQYEKVMVTDINTQVSPYGMSVFNNCHSARAFEGSRHRFIDSMQAGLINCSGAFTLRCIGVSKRLVGLLGNSIFQHCLGRLPL